MAVLEGKAYWASVTTPNTTFEPVYTVDVVVDEEVANSFEARGFKVKETEQTEVFVLHLNFSIRIKNLWIP